MSNLVAFLKKYLVLILCGALVLAALGAGIWYLVKPTGDNQTQETGESTGGFESDLDFDIGIGIPGEDESDFVDTPNGENASDNVTVITPNDQSGIVNVPGSDSSSGSVTPVTPDNQGSSSETTPGNNGTSSDNGNSDSNPGNEDTTSPTENQSQPVDMVGGVVDNPFN